MFVVCGWGWGIPEDSLERVQQRLKCYVTKESHLTQNPRYAASFQCYDDAQAHLWCQDEWWAHSEEDGTPNYWIEEIS